MSGNLPKRPVDTSLNISGKEGVDINYLSRVRAQYVITQHTTMLHQIQFADAKAAALMALIGLLTLRGPIPIEAATSNIIDSLFVLVAALTILFSLAAIMPRFPGRSKRERLLEMECWSWPALSANSLEAEDYALFIQTSEQSELLHSVANSNVIVARLLRRKFLYLRISFVFATCAILLLGAHFGYKM